MSTLRTSAPPAPGRLPSDAETAYLETMRTASALSRDVDRFLQPYNITQAQYNVLRILRGAGSDGLCRYEISARLVTAMPDVSRLLDRMEASGWVKRMRGRVDRRQVSTSITEQGLRLIASLDEPIHAFHHAQFNNTPPEALQQITDTLRQVRESLPSSNTEAL